MIDNSDTCFNGYILVGLISPAEHFIPILSDRILIELLVIFPTLIWFKILVYLLSVCLNISSKLILLSSGNNLLNTGLSKQKFDVEGSFLSPTGDSW